MLKNKPKVPEPVKAKTEVDELPDDIFSKPVNLMESKLSAQINSLSDL